MLFDCFYRKKGERLCPGRTLFGSGGRACVASQRLSFPNNPSAPKQLLEMPAKLAAKIQNSSGDLLFCHFCQHNVCRRSVETFRDHLTSKTCVKTRGKRSAARTLYGERKGFHRALQVFVFSVAVQYLLFIVFFQMTPRRVRYRYPTMRLLLCLFAVSL